jgi:hypothetical protein
LPGKIVGGFAYLHSSLFGALDAEHMARIQEVEERLRDLDATRAWTVAKISVDGSARLSLLDYEDFERFAFPALRASVRFGPETGLHKVRMESKENPSILHRKELLLPLDHPLRPGFSALTCELECRGLYRDMKRMGRRRPWERRLLEAGIAVNSATHEVIEL